MQKLLKSTLPACRNSVNGTDTPAGYPLSLNRHDESVLLELSCRVIQGPHIYIRIALNHRVSETALDLIRMEIAPVQDAKNE